MHCDVSGSDESLAKVFRNGDGAAGEVVVRRWGPKVFVYCRTMLRDDHKAEDACQEVFYRMVRHIGRYDDSRPFGPWLLGIARNVCLGVLDKASGRDVSIEDVAEPQAPTRDVGEMLLQREHKELLGEAIDALPRRYRELLIYMFQAELPSREIAELMGIAPQSIYVYYQRAMNLLRKKVRAGHA